MAMNSSRHCEERSMRRSNLKNVIASGKKRPRNGYGKVGVLMGGPSSEREISLKSGRAVCAALKEVGQDVVSIDILSDKKAENSRLIASKRLDCAFIALHGRYGEDGAIQEILDGLKIPYTGSGVTASQLAMDKSASLEIFRQNGLTVPGYEVVEIKSRAGAESKCAHLLLPWVVKPASQGSSIGLSVIKRKDDLNKAMELAFKFDQKIIVCEYISGRELTVGVLDIQALPVVEIIPKHRVFDYRAKYTSGLTNYEVPAKLSKAAAEKISVTGLSAHKLLGCFGCSRTDIILGDDGKTYILEVNTIPGMTATSLLPKAAVAAGIGFSELCLKLIKLAYEKI